MAVHYRTDTSIHDNAKRVSDAFLALGRHEAAIRDYEIQRQAIRNAMAGQSPLQIAQGAMNYQPARQGGISGALRGFASNFAPPGAAGPAIAAAALGPSVDPLQAEKLRLARQETAAEAEKQPVALDLERARTDLARAQARYYNQGGRRSTKAYVQYNPETKQVLSWEPGTDPEEGFIVGDPGRIDYLLGARERQMAGQTGLNQARTENIQTQTEQVAPMAQSEIGLNRAQAQAAAARAAASGRAGTGSRTGLTKAAGTPDDEYRKSRAELVAKLLSSDAQLSEIQPKIEYFDKLFGPTPPAPDKTYHGTANPVLGPTPEGTAQQNVFGNLEALSNMVGPAPQQAPAPAAAGPTDQTIFRDHSTPETMRQRGSAPAATAPTNLPHGMERRQLATSTPQRMAQVPPATPATPIARPTEPVRTTPQAGRATPTGKPAVQPKVPVADRSKEPVIPARRPDQNVDPKVTLEVSEAYDAIQRGAPYDKVRARLLSWPHLKNWRMYLETLFPKVIPNVPVKPEQTIGPATAKPPTQAKPAKPVSNANKLPATAGQPKPTRARSDYSVGMDLGQATAKPATPEPTYPVAAAREPGRQVPPIVTLELSAAYDEIMKGADPDKVRARLLAMPHLKNYQAYIETMIPKVKKQSGQTIGPR